MTHPDYWPGLAVAALLFAIWPLALAVWLCGGLEDSEPNPPAQRRA